MADKGLNSSDNISYSLSNGDGYMFSKILRGKKGKRYHEKLFNESLYTVVDENYKYQLFEEEYIDDKQTDENGKKIKIPRKRKVLIYYNGLEAKRAKRKSEKDVDKLKKEICNNVYGIVHGKKRYLAEISIVETTGEIAEGKQLDIDYNLVEEDEIFDGYFVLLHLN